MCDVVVAAAAALVPENLELSRPADLPSPTGLVLLPHPLLLRTIGGDVVDDRAYHWPIPAPIPRSTLTRTAIPACRVATYSDTHRPVQPDSFRQFCDAARRDGEPPRHRCWSTTSGACPSVSVTAARNSTPCARPPDASRTPPGSTPPRTARTSTASPVTTHPTASSTTTPSPCASCTRSGGCVTAHRRCGRRRELPHRYPRRRTGRRRPRCPRRPTQRRALTRRLRHPDWHGNSGVHLHALASLLAQAYALLPKAVADARDQGLTWTEIGQLLGLSADTTARRYRPHQ